MLINKCMNERKKNKLTIDPIDMMCNIIN